MPRYDYRCAGGHVTEKERGYDVVRVTCPICGASAQRLAVYQGVQVMGDGINTHQPTKEAPVNVTRFMEAHGQILYEAEKAHVTPPDFLGIAKERIRRGDVKAYN